MFGGGRNQHTTAQTPWVTCLSSYTAAGLELPTRGVNRGLPLKGHEAQILFIYMLRWSKRVCFKPLFGLNSFIVLSIRLLYFSCLEETAFLYLGKFFFRPSSDVSKFKLQGKSQTCWQSSARSMALYGLKARDGGSFGAANPQTPFLVSQIHFWAKGSAVGCPTVTYKFLMIFDWTIWRSFGMSFCALADGPKKNHHFWEQSLFLKNIRFGNARFSLYSLLQFPILWNSPTSGELKGLACIWRQNTRNLKHLKTILYFPVHSWNQSTTSLRGRRNQRSYLVLCQQLGLHKRGLALREYIFEQGQVQTEQLWIWIHYDHERQAIIRTISRQRNFTCEHGEAIQKWWPLIGD